MNPNNVGLGTSTLMTDEDEKYYRAIADEGKGVSLYCRPTKSEDFKAGEDYIISIMVRPQYDSYVTVHDNANVTSTRNQIFVRANEWTTVSTKCAKLSNTDAFLLVSDMKNCYLDYKNLKMEKGNTVTPWMPSINDEDYQNWGLLNKKPLLYYNPTTQTWEKPVLREWDSIEKHGDGKYYYHKRSEEVVLDGSENWTGGPLYTNVYRYWATTTKASDIKDVRKDDIGICDRFDYYYTDYDSDKSGINVMPTGVNAKVLKSEVDKYANINKYFQANPTTVVYQLAKEEVYECANLDLITYNGETNLIVNSGAIQPKITLKVLSNVSNVVKLLQEKVSILENKFIKGLQQVLAGDMMSLAHLLYPEDFENNHEIQTLEL